MVNHFRETRTKEIARLYLLLTDKTHSFASAFCMHMKKIFKQNLEVLIWIAALTYLVLIDPFTVHQFSLCPLHNLGFEQCPGCGLGRSISHALHGNIAASFSIHILGIPAVLVLLLRIVTLIRLRRNYPQVHNASHLHQEPPCQT